MKKKKIDLLDIAMLNILKEHAELSNKDLAKLVGLSEGSTLVRSQNLWKRGFIGSVQACIQYKYFGYDKYYLLRLEVLETAANDLLTKLLECRHLITLIGMEARFDITMRIFLAVILTRDLRTADKEMQALTSGFQGISSFTFTQMNFIMQRQMRLEETDYVK